jgi:hypothetical protein
VRDNYAVSFDLMQWGRVVGGRTGLGVRHRALNNVLVACPCRIVLGRRTDNESDGNLFDAADNGTSFCIRHPEPPARQNLAGWQTYYDLDRNSTQATIEADFDVEALRLAFRMEGDAPQCRGVALLHGDDATPAPGPFDAAAWSGAVGGETVTVRFPLSS